MDNNKLKWYETHLEEFLKTTIYEPTSLTVELPEKEWLEINPTRGIKHGIECYDLTKCKENSFIKILHDSYGEYEYNRSIIDGHVFRFNRRTLAAGGGLYPNCIYVVLILQNETLIYQYNPALNFLHLLKKSNVVSDRLKKGTCYFVITNYYWRNFLKYRYFGYRLMLVDTGYLLSNLCLTLSRNNLSYNISISTKLFKLLEKCINVDLNYESICAVVFTENKRIIESLKNIEKFKTDYKIFDDWDTTPTPLYRILETKVNSENFDVNEAIDNTISECQAFYDFKYRVSPGGGPMISTTSLKNIVFSKTLKNFNNLRSQFKNFSKNVEVYIYVNKIENLSPGLYLLKSNGTLDNKPCNYTSKDFQQMLRKKNFNLQEVPAFFFFGTDLKKMIDKYGISGFKISQIKIGFVSQLLTYAACLTKCWTHAILGFEVDMAEKFVGTNNNLNLLNLVVFSESKPLDRFSLKF